MEPSQSLHLEIILRQHGGKLVMLYHQAITQEKADELLASLIHSVPPGGVLPLPPTLKDSSQHGLIESVVSGKKPSPN